MRNVPYSERIKQFVETNCIIRNTQYGNSPIVDYSSFMNRLSSQEERELTRETTLSDFTDIWSQTVSGYLQNIGLGSIEPQPGYLDGVRMYTTPVPVFGISAPVSYRTPEEIRTGNHPQFVFSCDPMAFDTKQGVIDYLISELIQGKDIFLYSLDRSPLVYEARDFRATRKWIVRLKVVDWAQKLNRTDFSFLKVKKNFTPTKNIPKFTM